MSELVSGQKIAAWRYEAKEAAIAASISPQEVDWLLQEVTELDSLALRLESFKERSQLKSDYSLPQLAQLWQQRLTAKVPVQYLVGKSPWRNFVLKVSPDVLIPRPETECLIDLARDAVKDIPHLREGHWVDLGTGSGAIALGLAEVFPNATIHGIDFSKAALEVAKANGNQLGLHKVEFHQGFWWEPLAHLKGKVAGMVSNPPYIPTTLLETLQPEVTKHEPHLALDGGDNGLDCIKYLIRTAPDYLCSGAVFLIEMMMGQGEEVKDILQQQGSYKNISIIADLAGVERFALAYCV